MDRRAALLAQQRRSKRSGSTRSLGHAHLWGSEPPAGGPHGTAALPSEIKQCALPGRSRIPAALVTLLSEADSTDDRSFSFSFS
jgi:hypothetical protein